ncbi:hypothetical protein ACLMJK_006128 [Lecanora helva]
MAEANVQHEVVDLEDDRPIAVRRKRRLSTGPTAPVVEFVVQKCEDDAEQPPLPAKTPTKSKKRVRFSDPGPDSSNISSSTGLTPHLKRTSFSANDHRLSLPSKPARLAHRMSLPDLSSRSLPSPSLSPSPVALSGELQFEPLRQILDPRMKRRLKRNGLSEEINNIEADQREISKHIQENQDLKQQLALAKEARDEEHSGNEKKEGSNSAKVLELEEQIQDLKEQLREQPVARVNLEADVDSLEKPETDFGIFVDNDEDDIRTPNSNDVEQGVRGTDSLEASNPVSEATTQASLPSAPLANTFREARLSLEYLFPGEITLGLVVEDPKPMLDFMLDRIRELKAEILFTEESLSRIQGQESNLRNQFNAVLGQLDRARDYAEHIRTVNKNEKSRADAAEAKVEVLESAVQTVERNNQQVEKSADEKDRSIQKLQDALETYRGEVRKLEMLIVKLDGENNAALSALRNEMDEAVADLECHVVAKTRGRREAEQELIARDEKIKQLQHQEEELKKALSEKQQIIRETERIFEEERVGREREVGGLNVHIGQLSTKLSESKTKVRNAEENQRGLMKKLQEERDEGVRAVEAVQAELASCRAKVEEVQASYVNDVQKRGAEVTQHQGLLTPVSVTRFKDIHVEGDIEMRRGAGRSKKRPDSGIVILEEDEDTIMSDDL